MYKLVSMFFQVLRPYSNLANLKVWDYYLTEDLAHGPSYDIEVVNREIRQNEEHEMIEGLGLERRKIINGCYDNILLKQPDFFRWQLQVRLGWGGLGFGELEYIYPMPIMFPHYSSLEGAAEI